MDINISAMAYSPVSPNLEISNQWQEMITDAGSELEVFERYIQEIILKSDINDVTRGEFVNENTNPENWLEALKTANLDDDPSQFKSASKSLSEELNSIIHSNSKDGVLFCVQAEVESSDADNVVEEPSDNIVSLLKLDLVEEERLQLSNDRTLSSLDLDDIFPEPKELQKGLIYPIVKSLEFRLPGDVKFYQDGTVSDYFHDFIECQIIESSLKQAKSVFSIIGEMKEEHRGESPDGDDVNRFRNLRSQADGELIGVEEVTEVASEIVGRDVSPEEITSRMDIENPDSLAIDTHEMPSYVRYEVDSEIRVRFPSSAEDRVVKKENEEGVKVEIRGGDIETIIVDK